MASAKSTTLSTVVTDDAPYTALVVKCDECLSAKYPIPS
jgi:hypothetical protein